jgi:hypothetical protein
MATIRELLLSQTLVVHDRQLAWGAKASAYRDEISACRAVGRIPVLVELNDDLGVQSAASSGEVRLIDHHGDRAGENAATALEQVFRLLDRPADEWSRHYALVAANDRGYIEGMLALDPPASREEIQSIRAADRQAQGISADKEAAGRTAAAQSEQFAGGRLTVVRLPHNRMVTASDALHAALGGPGFENLLILSPSQTLYQGDGRAIERLKELYPGGWWGGSLPKRGYWGIAHNLEKTAIIQDLEQIVSTKPASEIEVKAFRHTVLCPLLLRGDPRPLGDRSDAQGILQGWVKEFSTNGGAWKEQTEPGIHPRFAYNQIVYFHPFVRDFLFGDGDKTPHNNATRLLTRTDVQQLEVELGKWQPEGVRLRFDVARVELYLCKPCVAILVIELRAPRYSDKDGTVKLSELQDFTDQFRRLYTPFWWDEGTKGLDAVEPGLCLRELQWRNSSGATISVNDEVAPGYECALGSPKKFFDVFSRKGAEPPLFTHWLWLLGKDVRPAETHEHTRLTKGSPDELFVQQLLDERMPCMSYFAVADPAEVSLGDRDRLTFIDASGTDAFPYDDSFLAEHRAKHTYARFANYDTHYLCSGYGFAMLGKASDSHFGNILPEHFSQHYFCLALIAHYQRAALLYFADELSSSLKDLSGKPISEELADPGFRKHIEEIQHRFLKFRTRMFFPEVSNQLQGKELFRMWFDTLETERLFALVDTASERLTSVLAERESRQLARVANSLAPWFVGLAVASCLFGATSFIRIENWYNRPDMTFWLIVLVSLLSGLGARFGLSRGNS